MITFVTGIYGAGKTTLAREIAARDGLEYVSFDDLHTYGEDATAVLGKLPAKDFVCDAIPFTSDPVPRNDIYEPFRAYLAGNPATVIVKGCSRDEWRRRVGERANDMEWLRFHLGILPDVPADRFYCDDGPVSRSGFMSLVGYEGMVKELGELGKGPTWPGHDWKYQDAPELGLAGYSESHRTWDGLQPALAMLSEARSFIDAGCNHGYFAFRLEEAGRSVVGLDDHDGALYVAKGLAFMRGSSVKFRGWNAKADPFPAADCTMILNALHHFGPACLETLSSPWLLLEAHTEEVRGVPGYELAWEGESHRPNRVLALLRRS